MSNVQLKLVNEHRTSKDLINLLTKHFNETLKSAQHGIKNEVKLVVSQALRKCSELVDLNMGEFRGMMGLTSGKASAAVSSYTLCSHVDCIQVFCVLLQNYETIVIAASTFSNLTPHR